MLVADEQRGPAEVRHLCRSRGLDDEATSVVEELHVAILGELDDVAILVDVTVVVTALCRVRGYAG